MEANPHLGDLERVGVAVVTSGAAAMEGDNKTGGAPDGEAVAVITSGEAAMGKVDSTYYWVAWNSFPAYTSSAGVLIAQFLCVQAGNAVPFRRFGRYGNGSFKGGDRGNRE
jgi:hypothetical protein